MFCAWRVFKPEENCKGLLWANQAHLSPPLGLSGGALGRAGLSLLLLLLGRHQEPQSGRGQIHSPACTAPREASSGASPDPAGARVCGWPSHRPTSRLQGSGKMKTWGDGEEGCDPGDNEWSFLRCLYLKA